MVSDVPFEVLHSIARTTIQSLKSHEIFVLSDRRQFLVKKVQNFGKYIDDMDAKERNMLYPTLVLVCTQLDWLRESGEQKWCEAAASFFASRTVLEVLDKEIAKVDAALIKAANISYEIERNADESTSDLQVDLIRATFFVENASINEEVTDEAKETLKSAKLFFEKAKNGDVVKLLADADCGLVELKDQVAKLANREAPTPIDPAAEQTTTHKAFKLDITNDDDPSSLIGNWVRNNRDGSLEHVECYVFLPGATAHIIKIWVKKRGNVAFDFKVTLDGVEVWAQQNVAKSEDAKTFQSEGHKYTVKYQSGGETWWTKVDGSLCTEYLTHQDWAGARARHSYQITMRAVLDIMTMDL